MPIEPHRPPELRKRIFRGRDALRAGLLTPAQLRSAAWLPLMHGVYADANLRVDHRARCRAALLVCPTGATIAGRSAAWLLGAPLVNPDDPVEVIVPCGRRVRRQRDLCVRSATLADDEVIRRRDGLRLTTGVRTAWDLAGRGGLVDAVVCVDVLLRTRVVRRDVLAAYATGRTGQGAGRARRAIALADGRAESPPETKVRLAFVLAGLPPPVPQHEIWLHGHFLARVDLAWPERGVAVEYDGAGHAGPRQMRRDRDRLNHLLAAGWHVVHVTATDLSRLDRIVELVGHVLAA